MVWKISMQRDTIVLLMVKIALISVVHSQNCGIVGHTFGEPVLINGIADSTGPQIQIWQGELIDVRYHIFTGVDPGPHNKYLKSSLDSSFTVLSIQTSDQFQNFIPEQGQVLLVRNITFSCADGTRSEQNFEISVHISDLYEPKFLANNYGLNPISEREVPGTKKSINGGVMIIVGDTDVEFVDADLTFRTTLINSENNEEVIKAIGTKLWENSVGPSPSGLFYYRVDMYLNQAIEANTYEFDLVASSRLKSGSTTIKITVVNELLSNS